LGEIRDRLWLACRASTALSLASLVLDGHAEEDVRAEAAQDLEGLVAEPRTLKELEAVLSAAPFPPAADVVGSERICMEISASIVHCLLTRLVARQGLIRSICAAWNALPSDVFASEASR